VKSSWSRRAYLVELEVVEQVVELPVLLLLVELEEVLLQTVQGELGLVVDVDLKRLYLYQHRLLPIRYAMPYRTGRGLCWEPDSRSA
jgi:hypothetical protein